MALSKGPSESQNHLVGKRPLTSESNCLPCTARVPKSCLSVCGHRVKRKSGVMGAREVTGRLLGWCAVFKPSPEDYIQMLIEV